jgi:hypothetical protein
MMPSSGERRTCRRTKFSGITFVWTTNRELPCVAGNLSESGILVYPQRRAAVAPGHSLRLSFTLPSVGRWIQLDGLLVYRSERTRREAWGVQFQDVPTEIKHLLRAYVAQGEPPGAPAAREQAGAPPTARARRPTPAPNIRRRPGTLATWRSDGEPIDPEGTVAWDRSKNSSS